MKKSSPPKVCITLPLAYPRFNPSYHAPFGGIEVRVSLIARELARRGHFRVAIVTGDFGQPHIEQREGITFYSWKGREIWGVSRGERNQVTPERLSLLRRVFNRSRSYMQWFMTVSKKNHHLTGMVAGYPITHHMLSVYDEVDADIYLVPGNSFFSAEMAFYCQQRDKKYVFLAGSDYDYYPEYCQSPKKSDMYGTPYALKAYAIEQACAHIVQNERQAQMLRDGYNLSSTIIRNPLDLTLQFPRNPSARTILWVGKSDERVKRPSLVLKLARQLPDYEFVIIMTVAIRETHDHCLKIAKKLPNVTLVEFVPFEQVERYFANARVHLNTSNFEGFPNTFLQAAKYSVPTISLQVDPGGMLSQHDCGLVCGGDFKVMKENVRALMADDERCAKFGQQSLTYVRKFHDKEIIIQKHERALYSVLGSLETE